jgi:glycine cleavage system H protein
MSASIPSELRYAKSHEWVKAEGSSVRVGITDHAQHELTDVVFVELPAVGRRVKVGEAVAVVESVKTASDIYSPISGEVIAVNPALSANPGLVNSDPYGAGWFCQLKLTNPAELDALLDATGYQALIQG